MRRRTILLAAGFSAYLNGASVRAYLRDPEDLRGRNEAGCRSVAVVEHPRASFLHPIKAINYLFAPVCND